MEEIRYGVGGLGRVFVLRLGPGTDLLRALQGFAREQRIGAGVILSGVASLRRATLRNVVSAPEPFPITDANRVYTPKDEVLELVALAGNIAQRGDEVVVHAHFTVSSGSEPGLAYGGHPIEGCEILSTGELVIPEITGTPVMRQLDPETKAAELYFE